MVVCEMPYPSLSNIASCDRSILKRFTKALAPSNEAFLMNSRIPISNEILLNTNHSSRKMSWIQSDSSKIGSNIAVKYFAQIQIKPSQMKSSILLRISSEQIWDSSKSHSANFHLNSLFKSDVLGKMMELSFRLPHQEIAYEQATLSRSLKKSNQQSNKKLSKMRMRRR